MRRLLIRFYLLIAFFGAAKTQAQDFSNKGNDFWVGYGYHVRMNTGNGGSQQMVLYFATEAVTNVTVSIPSLGYSKTYTNIPANTIFTSDPLPKTGSQDARLTSEGISSKGIHITSDKPVVAYAHIYDGNVSGATLLFPTNTLGKEYYSVNATQISNENLSNSWFYAIAVDTGTTVVQITPSANTLNHQAGVPFTVNLQQGEIINIMGQLIRTGSDPYTGYDLTGSTIKSISSGTGGCKRIAVFSGSGKISLTCNGNSSSADNYIVQAFPKTAWGKRYLTAPTRNLPYNFFRICVSDPSTVVKVNGNTLSGLQNGFYYEITSTVPQLIEADKPILVAQYITTQNACGNGSPGDPEVIYLSPVEQNIDKVILNSTPNYAIQQHFINVVIRSSVVSSFRLDGGTVSGFQTHPQDASFSYAQLQVTAGKHTLQADSGFNAIAYGYGPAESYGYNAGTNVKDLYQFASVKNEYATVNFPAACKNSPFYFYMTFPYQPAQIKWVFGQVLNSMGIKDVSINSPVYDSTWMVNGKQLYRYKLPTAYTITAIGTYPIRILAQNPTPEGCSGDQEIDYDLQVFERPAASFTISSSGCVSDSVRFTDNSNLSGRNSTMWFWNFGDNGTSALHNPAHLYKTAGSFPVKFSLVSDIGCLSDTATQTVVITEPPVAKFGLGSPACMGNALQFQDSSSSTTSPIAKWTWDFGDGTPASNLSSPTHTYPQTGSYQVTLLVEAATGCRSNVATKTITVHPVPKAGFIVPGNCINDPITKFTDTSAIADGSEAQFQWAWNFGDQNAAPANNVSTAKNGQHRYTAAGDYNVSLKLTSKDGCSASSTQVFTLNGAVPVSQFFLHSGTQLCAGDTVAFTDNSFVSPGKLVKLEIYWDYNGDPTNKITVDKPAKGATYEHVYPAFFTPTTKTYRVKLVIYSGVTCLAEKDTLLVLNAQPVIQFNTAGPVCANAPAFQLQASATNMTTGTGMFTGNGVSTDGVFNPALAGAGLDMVRYTYTSAEGCQSFREQALTVYPVPTVTAGPDKAVLEGGSATLNGEATGNNLTYLWTPPTALNNPAISQPVVTPTLDMTYTLTVTSEDGCTASDQVLVKVLKALSIPNAFSPNGDGVHDKWEILYLDSYPGATVEVFNRYGQKVFESRGYTKPWDGTLNGKQLPIGTYYYLIDPKNGRKPIAGFVDIIR
jgi:gliding motility-associated-like protein